jgi:hypothetical protein
MPTTQQVTNLLKKEFQKKIRSGPDITREAIDELLGDRKQDPDWIKENFSSLIEDIQSTAYELYLSAERQVGADAVEAVFLGMVGPHASGQEVFEALREHFHSLDRFFLGLTNGRRPRAGNAFEQAIRELFTVLDYPFSRTPNIDGIPDFILPSETYYRKNPLGSLIFTVKRTLRERWRQIVTEGSKGLGFFLGTIDERVTQRDLGEMMRGKIHLVVPARLKTNIGHYWDAPNVMSFEHFFKFHVDPAIERWREEEQQV